MIDVDAQAEQYDEYDIKSLYEYPRYDEYAQEPIDVDKLGPYNGSL